MRNIADRWCDTCADELGVGRCPECESFCVALGDTRLAGEIAILEWVLEQDPKPSEVQEELDRLRAELAGCSRVPFEDFVMAKAWKPTQDELRFLIRMTEIASSVSALALPPIERGPLSTLAGKLEAELARVRAREGGE